MGLVTRIFDCCHSRNPPIFLALIRKQTNIPNKRPITFRRAKPPNTMKTHVIGHSPETWKVQGTSVISNPQFPPAQSFNCGHGVNFCVCSRVFSLEKGFLLIPLCHRKGQKIKEKWRGGGVGKQWTEARDKNTLHNSVREKAS